MCEFCHEHGEGKKWYLQAKNYAEDLQSDLLRRMNVPNTDAPSLMAGKPGFARAQYRKLDQRPRWLRSLLKPCLSTRVLREQKERHFGQVIPIEDAESIFDMVNTIVRVACVCRRATIGREERYCYGVSMGHLQGGLRSWIPATWQDLILPVSKCSPRKRLWTNCGSTHGKAAYTRCGLCRHRS